MTFQNDQTHFKHARFLCKNASICGQLPDTGRDAFLRAVKIIEKHSNDNWKILIERSFLAGHPIRRAGFLASNTDFICIT